jgi:hypothetical protein
MPSWLVRMEIAFVTHCLVACICMYIQISLCLVIHVYMWILSCENIYIICIYVHTCVLYIHSCIDIIHMNAYMYFLLSKHHHLHHYLPGHVMDVLDLDWSPRGILGKPW